MNRDLIEQLEDRRHLSSDTTAPRIAGVFADNRGQITVSFTERVTNLNNSTLKVFTSGADFQINTADDVRQPNVTWSFLADQTTLVINANTGINQAYRLRLDRTITDLAGNRLDGEFTGTRFPSGDGVAGGNFILVARRDNSTTPLVRMVSNLGVIMLRLRRDAAPQSALVFQENMNGGRFDNIFVTRSVPGFVIQMGSMRYSGDGSSVSQISEQTSRQIPPETPRVLSNVRGSVSLARGGAQGLGGNQFFFNLVNNPNLDTTTPIFTPFAVVEGSRSLGVMDAIAARPIVAVRNQFDGVPAGVLQSVTTTATGLTNVPLVSEVGLTITQTEVDRNQIGQPISGRLVTAGLVPNRDLVVFTRVGQLMRVGGA